jgi:hypothetical protein
LEAITEIPFPRRENLCTRFATEIVLRRVPTPSIRTRIIPEKTRLKQEQADPEQFRESISDFHQLLISLIRRQSLWVLQRPQIKCERLSSEMF